MAGLHQPARKVHGTVKIKTPNLESMLSPTLSFYSWENGGSERSKGWPVSKQALAPVNLVLFGPSPSNPHPRRQMLGKGLAGRNFPYFRLQLEAKLQPP